MPLTDSAVKNAKARPKLFKLSDGQGLQLWVHPDGAKRWRLAYRYQASQRVLAIGVYPSIGLKQAREARSAAKSLLAAGQDPMQVKRASRVAKAIAAENDFATVANHYLAKKRRENKSEATITKLEWLLDLAIPVLGQRPVAEITAPEVLSVLQTIEARGRHETATRLRSFIGAVFRFAVATHRAVSDPTTSLKGALTAPTVTHRAAITKPDRFGALLRSIETYDGAPETRVALSLLALTFVRPGELRGAAWSEVDLDAATWTIPSERMKMRRPHHVPLASQATALLRELRAMTGRGPLLFPSVRSVNRPMSENTLNAALRRLGWKQDEMSAHGFRSAASSMLNECGLWNPDAIERQLAHVDKDENRRAYARAEFWDERVRMMQWWADQLDGMRAGCAITPTKVLRMQAAAT